MPPPSNPIAVKKISGSSEGITHSIDQDEVNEFASNINQVLSTDNQLKHLLPLDLGDELSLFTACKDGLVLCKLINSVAPQTIDERVLNMKPHSLFQKTENINIAIQSAKSLGCSTVNIGPNDIVEGRPHLVLGLIWQIIKIGLFSKDGEIYIHLLHALSPESMDLKNLSLGPWDRAESIVAAAEKMDCKTYATARSITSGNSRLNLAFVATLFNKWPGLAPLDHETIKKVSDAIHEVHGDREARSFLMWLNSLGIEPFLSNILWDLRDGTALLSALRKLYPNEAHRLSIPSKRASRFQMIENTNLVVNFCKNHLKLSLVGIQGSDITDGSPSLTKALVWQLMRDHLLKTLRDQSGAPLRDTDLLAWANEQVSTKTNSTKKIASFGDPSLKTGYFLLDLLSSIDPNIERITESPHETEEKWIENARYILTLARRMGATLFLLPEDIVECKSKMIMTFVASLMSLGRKH